MLVGYARVSTGDQNVDLQEDALKNAGFGRLFTDTASGAQTDGQGPKEALDFIRPGDTLVVWKLDRLGRSLKHLIETVQALAAREIGFRRASIPPPVAGSSSSTSSPPWRNSSRTSSGSGPRLGFPRRGREVGGAGGPGR